MIIRNPSVFYAVLKIFTRKNKQTDLCSICFQEFLNLLKAGTAGMGSAVEEKQATALRTVLGDRFYRGLKIISYAPSPGSRISGNDKIWCSSDARDWVIRSLKHRVPGDNVPINHKDFFRPKPPLTFFLVFLD